MIDKINENDLLTLDDDSKYFILATVDDFNSKFHLLIAYDEDQEEFDTNDVSFVEEVKENGEIYLEPIDNKKTLEKLSYYVITNNLLETVPGLDDALAKEIENKLYKGSQ